MKNLAMIFVLGCLFAACGDKSDNNDDNVKTIDSENYPTYDTTETTRHINDSVSDGGMRSGGALRHNVDEETEKQ